MQKKRGRPPKAEGEHHTKLMISIAPDMLRAVDAFAEEFGATRSAAMDTLLKTGLTVYLLDEPEVAAHGDDLALEPAQ